MRSANAIFRALFTDCAAFSSLWDDAIFYNMKSPTPVSIQALRVKTLRELADAIEKEHEIA